MMINELPELGLGKVGLKMPVKASSKMRRREKNSSDLYTMDKQTFQSDHNQAPISSTQYKLNLKYPGSDTNKKRKQNFKSQQP